MIIIFINHCHVAPPGSINNDDPMEGTVERLVDIMNEFGFEKAVVFPFYNHRSMDPSDCYSLNMWLYEKIKKNDNLVGFVIVDPKYQDTIQTLEKFARKGFKGVKFHPPVFRAPIDDSEIEPFYSKCEELGLTLLIHTGVHRSTPWPLRHFNPLLIDDVAQRHPKLKIIVGHMGGLEFFHEALAVIRNNQNCYAGITSFSSFPLSLIKNALEKRCAGSDNVKDKIIYGLDYPWGETVDRIKSNLKILKRLKLLEKEVDNILGGNLERILLQE